MVYTYSIIRVSLEDTFAVYYMHFLDLLWAVKLFFLTDAEQFEQTTFSIYSLNKIKKNILKILFIIRFWKYI
jgi:hypothetical protein